ncbi:hypothetical protein LTR12_017710 [Friedmanniomyces endolithicus]|nr:hypothetical protein LTR12_017710 [Friedmanniomyces endolithicus]
MAPSPTHPRESYTVGIICALHVEKVAMETTLDKVYGGVQKMAGDDNSYSFGRIGQHTHSTPETSTDRFRSWWRDFIGATCGRNLHLALSEEPGHAKIYYQVPANRLVALVRVDYSRPCGVSFKNDAIRPLSMH